MEDILDMVTTKKKKTIFARLALFSALGAICCFVYFSKMIAGTILAYESLEQPPMVTIRITQFLTLASILFIVLSYLKKEPRSWVKGIATLLIILILLLFAGAISFYYYIESSK